LVSSFKPIIDGLKKAGVIEDDKPSVIGQPEYSLVKSARNDGYVKIIVESVDE
jgi:hypothetical protein